MNLKKFVSILFAGSALLAACQPEQKLGPEEVTVSANELSFSSAAETKTITLKATLDWGLQGYDDAAKAWLIITPESGKASNDEVTVSFQVLANPDNDRSATITFYGNIIHKQTVTVTQSGDKGDGEVITVAEFINKADTQNPYVLQGTVSNVNSSYQYFYLSDGTESVQIYKPVNFSSFSIENGGTARVKGVYKRFDKTDGTTVHEMDGGTILSYTAPSMADHIFAETFASSLGAFTEEIKSGTVAKDVWTYAATYKCAKATAYLNSTNNASEAWLVSPEIDLTSATAATLTFDHACKYFASVASEVALKVSKDGGEFVELVIPTYPAADFKFVSTGKISLKAFLGGKIKVALVYTSTATKAGTYEVQNFFIDAVDSGETVFPSDNKCSTVGEIINLPANTKFSCGTAMLVTAKSTGGVVVSDNTGNVYLYDNNALASVAIGDMITFNGARAAYNGVPEVVSLSEVKVVSSSATVTYPEAADITSGFDAYTSATATFISFTGTLSTSENNGTKYYNLEVPGATKQGSISLPLESLGLDALVGKLIKVTGYYNGLSSSKYHNIIAVSVEASDMSVLSVDKTAITVAASDESASFSIGGNVSWKVSCEDSNLTATPASGSGEATVALAFPANTDADNAKVYTVKVSTEDPAPVKEFTVVVTQKKASAGNAETVSVDFTKQISDLPQGSSAGVKDGTYTLGGHEFIIHATTNAYQAKSGENYYLLIGKADSYIQLPAIEGKALVNVQFLTGAGASENVILDIAKADGTKLGINSDKIKKGTAYSWDVTGEAGAAYRILVTNAYNAQFQTITLTYE
ncbi:MAG: BACON domain-containing protein [Bacteroidales bacterium]|nr:BACON domain-containing protein [Bacteroidales bacterium]